MLSAVFPFAPAKLEPRCVLALNQDCLAKINSTWSLRCLAAAVKSRRTKESADHVLVRTVPLALSRSLRNYNMVYGTGIPMEQLRSLRFWRIRFVI